MADPTLRVGIDTSQFLRGAEQVQSATKKMSDAAGGAAGAFKNFALQAASLAGIGVSLAAVVREASTAERNMVRLNALLRAQGNQAIMTARQVQTLASELSAVTSVDDDEIVAATTALLRMGNMSAETTRRTVELSASLNAASDKFGSVEGAAMAVGRALQNPGEGMRRLAMAGFGLSKATEDTIEKLVDQGKVIEAQELILDSLQSKLGDISTVYKNTFEGSVRSAQNAMGDFLQTVGESGPLNALTATLQELDKIMRSQAMLDFATNFGQLLGNTMSIAADATMGLLQALNGLFELITGQTFSGVFERVNLLFERTALLIKDARNGVDYNSRKSVELELEQTGNRLRDKSEELARQQERNARSPLAAIRSGGRVESLQEEIRNLKDKSTALREILITQDSTARVQDKMEKDAQGRANASNARIRALITANNQVKTSAEEAKKQQDLLLQGDAAVRKVEIARRELEAASAGKDVYEAWTKQQERFNDVKKYEVDLQKLAAQGYKLSNDQISKLVSEYGSLQEQLSGATAAMEQNKLQAERMEDVYRSAANGIRDSFKDAFQNILTTGDFSFKALGQSIKNSLYTSIAEIASVQIFEPIANSVFGSLGASTQSRRVTLPSGQVVEVPASGGSSGGGFSLSNLGDLGSLGKIFSGGNPFQTSTSFGGLFDSYNTVTSLQQLPSNFIGPPQQLTSTVMTPGSLGVSLGQVAGIANFGLSAFNFAQNPSVGSGFGLAGGALGALGALGMINPIVGAVGAIALPLIGGLFGGGAAKRRAAADAAAMKRQQELINYSQVQTEFINSINAQSGNGESEAARALRELSEQFNKLKAEADRLKASTTNLEEAYRQGRLAITRQFNDRISEALGQYTNDVTAQYNKLKKEQEQLIQEAIDAEGDLAKVRELNAKQLEQFFKSLSTEQIEKLGGVVSAVDTVMAKLRDLLQPLGTLLDQQIESTANLVQTNRQLAESMRQVANTLRGAARDLRGSDLTVLSPLQVLNNRRREFDTLLTNARAGSIEAINELPQAGNVLLQASRGYYASSAPYSSDFSMVTDALDEIASLSDKAAKRQDYAASLYEVQGRLLLAIREQLAKESPDAKLLREQQRSLEAVVNFTKVAASEQKEGNAISDFLAYLNQQGVTVSEQTLRVLQGTSSEDNLIGSIQDLIKKFDEYLSMLQRKEAAAAADEEYARLLAERDKAIDSALGPARTIGQSAVSTLSGIRQAGITRNNQVIDQTVNLLTGQVYGQSDDRGGGEIDRLNPLRDTVVSLISSYQRLTGASFDPTATLVVGTKYGSGYKTAYEGDNHSAFAINDYLGIATTVLKKIINRSSFQDPAMEAFVKGLNTNDLPGFFTALARRTADAQFPMPERPAFAMGGAFEVPQHYGNDQRLVSFYASGGEKVSITRVQDENRAMLPVIVAIEKQTNELSSRLMRLEQQTQRLTNEQMLSREQQSRRAS